jgi:hypothetical protein
MANSLEAAGYEIFYRAQGTYEFHLSACIDMFTGKWVLAPVSEFTAKCGGIDTTTGY